MKIILLLSFLSCATAMAAEEAGRVAIANGDVSITKDQAKPGKAAKPNDPIYSDEIIKTGSNGAAKVLFTDQSVMDLGPESALKISDYALKNVENRTGTFSLLYGKLRALVTKQVGPAGKLEVRTGSTVMGVRGTEFMVDKPRRGGGDGGPKVLVVSGRLEVRSGFGGPPIEVKSGQMLSARSDGKGEGSITHVSGEQMQSMMSNSKTEDNTFTNGVTIDTGGGGGSGESRKSEALEMLSSSEGGKLAKGDSDSQPKLPPPPPPPQLLLPPVNIIPGNRVSLTVNIQ